MKGWMIAIACMGLFFASCHKEINSAKEDKKMLRLSIPTEPPTLDPRKGSDVVSSTLHFMLFEGLVRLNPDGSVTPAQAGAISISKDKKTYTFHLRETTWSDGTPVTAHDFEKSWKDILDPTFPAANAQLLYPIKNADSAKKGLVPLSEVGIKATDKKTLVVELIRPTPYFLELISFCVFFPVNHKVDEKDHNWAYHANSHFTSNGYYILKKWKHHGEIVLEKNPHYWNPNRINIDQIHFSMVDNETTVLQMYERGELDMLGQLLSPLPIDALPKLKEQGILTISPTAGSTFCAFNTKSIPFCNKNMRKAFTYAMNRHEIVNNITQLDEIPAYGAIPPILKGNKTRTFYKDNDVKLAQEYFKKGLRELGLNPHELELTYVYTTSELDHKIAQALQQQWQDALGVRVNLENVDHKILLDKLTKRNYTFAQTVWYAQYSDQMNLLERYKSKENVKNYAAWENPKFISLIDQSFLTSSPKERLEILEKAEEIFTDDLPISVIYHKNSITLLKPHVKNVQYTSIGNLCFERLDIDRPSEGERR